MAAEPDNPYDANAVAVWIQGLKVGYLSREDALRYQPGLLALEQKHGKPIALAGVIAGVECEPMARVGSASSSSTIQRTSAFNRCLRVSPGRLRPGLPPARR